MLAWYVTVTTPNDLISSNTHRWVVPFTVCRIFGARRANRRKDYRTWRSPVIEDGQSPGNPQACRQWDFEWIIGAWTYSSWSLHEILALVEGKDVHLEEFIRGMILDEKRHLRNWEDVASSWITRNNIVATFEAHQVSPSLGYGSIPCLLKSWWASDDTILPQWGCFRSRFCLGMDYHQ